MDSLDEYCARALIQGLTSSNTTAGATFPTRRGRSRHSTHSGPLAGLHLWEA